MAGSMSRADLVADLKASLQSAAQVFTDVLDGDFIRHLDIAAQDMSAKRMRTLLGTITLSADRVDYPVPADFYSYKMEIWSAKARHISPWEKNHPGILPDVLTTLNGTVNEINLSPAPTAKQISILGARFSFYYYATHVIGDAAIDTTIQAGDRGLLLLRAQAEAMKELSMRNIGKPVAMRDGMTQGTRNGTPQYLFDLLMKLFQEA